MKLGVIFMINIHFVFFKKYFYFHAFFNNFLSKQRFEFSRLIFIKECENKINLDKANNLQLNIQTGLQKEKKLK